ncbi:hypothetical protein OO258_25860 [Pseudomonas sp. DCB_BI]|uniref:hypothetical protein n=1 Tax=Pseudomonas sp. DCB_BI TaxID=2993594 RepID=UPI00224ACEFE|nr:hypothetical protein [Pseudomonas sp. DCB_BI]MCX2891657.1 hypothetical protein [Pseudomonas sp. DCB_BI]
MTIAEVADGYFANLQPITVLAFFVVSAFAFFWRKGDEAVAIDSISKGATACAFPSGVAFVICAAYPGFVPKMADSSLAFSVGGTALMMIPFLDFKKIFQAYKQSA